MLHTRCLVTALLATLLTALNLQAVTTFTDVRVTRDLSVDGVISTGQFGFVSTGQILFTGVATNEFVGGIFGFTPFPPSPNSPVTVFTGLTTDHTFIWHRAISTSSAEAMATFADDHIFRMFPQGTTELFEPTNPIIVLDPNNGGSILVGGQEVLLESSGGSVSFGTGLSSGSSAIAGGQGSVAQGDSSAAFGNSTTASGNNAAAFGSNTQATGDASFAANGSGVASGTYSTALGFSTKAEAFASLAIGQFNVGTGTAGSWQEADPVFEIGIGSDALNPKNALTVYKNGDVTLSKAQGDISMGDFAP